MLADARLRVLDTARRRVLLLDEVAAHLDDRRREALFDEIAALGAQAWMTGTDGRRSRALGGQVAAFPRATTPPLAPRVRTA